MEFIAIFIAALTAIKNKYINKLKDKANSIAKVVAGGIGKASKMAKNAMHSKTLQSTLAVVSAAGILSEDQMKQVQRKLNSASQYLNDLDKDKLAAKLL